MKFSIKENKTPNVEKYSQEDFQVALDFAKKMHNEFGVFLKAIVLFGSTTKTTKNVAEPNDIDVLIVVDDVSLQLGPDMIETYRIITQKIMTKISKKLHITTLKLTSFWEYMRAGDPIGINILREGTAILDTWKHLGVPLESPRPKIESRQWTSVEGSYFTRQSPYFVFGDYATNREEWVPWSGLGLE